MRNVGDRSDPGDKQRAATIQDELGAVGVDVMPAIDPEDGRLGPYTFRRAWYYWSVRGPVPLAVAVELYEHPIGRRDVWVAGNGGRPPPEPPWLVDTRDGPAVLSYDIDSGAGLRLFVETIRKHGLDKVSTPGGEGP